MQPGCTGLRAPCLHLLAARDPDSGSSAIQSSNNVISHSKRAASVALMVGFGGAGSIFATTTFREQDSPRYVPGLWATVGCQLLLLALLLLTSVHYYRVNRIVRHGGPPVEGQQGFRYTL